MPNAREFATLIWFGALLIFVLSQYDLRSNVGGILRLVLGRKIGTSIALLVLWIVGEVFLAQQLNWWNSSMTTGTVFWAIGNGFVLMANAVTEEGKEHFLRRYLVASLRVSVFLGVFMSFSVLSLPIELVLQPFLFLLVGMLIVAGPKSENAQVRAFLNVILGLTIAGLAAYEVVALVGSSNVTGHDGLAWQLFLLVWLAFGLLPFVFGARLWAGYELAFTRTEWENGRRVGRRLALVTTFGPRAYQLAKFIRSSAWYLRDASTFRETRQAIQEARIAALADASEGGDEPS